MLPENSVNQSQSDSKKEQGITLGVIGAFLALLALSIQFQLPSIYVAMFAGAVGGMGHEFAQSGGKIAFYTVNKDGAYLGSLAGIPLGMIASFLVFQGNFSQNPSIILTQSIIAGLALKGVSEAVGGQAIPTLTEQIQILNSYWDPNSKTATITISNTGDIAANVANVFIDSKPYDVANGIIEPKKSKNIEIPNVQAYDSKIPLKAVTSSGKQATYSS